MTDLDTTLDGSPESIRAVSTWLRNDFGDAADELASSVWKQRSRAGGDWEGDPADGFQSTSRELAQAADYAHQHMTQVSGISDDLATALQKAISGMETVRSDARSGGLTVVGKIVRDPGPGPAEAGPHPGPDATPRESSAWDDANDAVVAHNAKVTVWNKAVADANGHFEDWLAALEDSASAWKRWDKELAGLTGALLSSGVQIELIRRGSPILMAQADFLEEQATRLRGHADAIKMPDGSVPASERLRYYELLDEADALDGRAPGLRDEAVDFKLPKSLTRGLWAIDVLATGYSIHEDMEEGESAVQASTSNIAAMGASIAAGAYIGGAVGTAIPIPVVGTVTGVVVGAAVGTVVGAFTSGAVDSLFENGLTSLDDAGQAMEEGWNEITDTGEAIGDLASDAWDSIF